MVNLTLPFLFFQIFHLLNLNEKRYNYRSHRENNFDFKYFNILQYIKTNEQHDKKHLYKVLSLSDHTLSLTKL